MSKSNILQKIKQMFMEEETIDTNSFEETKEEVMENEYKNEISAKLVDGTEVKVMSKGDALSVGDMVLVKSGEEFVKAPECRHELEGGLVIFVDGEGFINDIETKETEEESEDDTEMEELFGMIEKMADMISKLKDEVVGLKRVNQSLEERFTKFSQEPIAESFEDQNKPKLNKFASKEEKLKFLGGR